MLKNSVDKLIITKAIRKVKQTCKGCDIESIGDKADCGGCYTGVIISTLEKQIPKKPTHKDTNITADGFYTQECGKCPTCGEWVADHENYCHECGTALDWSES